MKYKILIIDDEQLSLNIITEALEGIGKILSTTSSTKAIILYNTESPDIVISDYNMKDMNGIELLNKLNPLKSILISANPLPKNYKGIFMSKPLNLIELKKCVETLCKKI